MAAPGQDNLHSRMVAVLKVVLPLAALAILSSLFLFSNGINPEDAIPYAEVDVEDRLRDPRMTGAGFSGVTSDGGAITLTADEAVPQQGGGTARVLTGKLATADGGTTDITAGEVAIDNASGLAELSGGVQLNSSSGYQITAPGFGMALDRSWLESRGVVAADGPMGNLSADAMRLEPTPDGAGHVLVFNGNVRLLYQPQK